MNSRGNLLCQTGAVVQNDVKQGTKSFRFFRCHAPYQLLTAEGLNLLAFLCQRTALLGNGEMYDPAVGLIMDVRLGDSVREGDSLATLYLNKRELANDAVARMQKAIVISEDKPELPPLVYAAVSCEGVKRN